MQTLAVLLTCYNRINTTLKCLDYFYAANIPKNQVMDLYLVDDSSPDQTGQIVKDKYPDINIIYGNGSLYWNGGMRLAWDTAAKVKDYDFYLWLNDDTYIEQHALTTLLNDYFSLLKQNKESLVTGSLRDPETKVITYVGMYRNQRIEPNGLPQQCDSVPGNLVLVSRNIYSKIGNLSKLYTHGFGDTDYGLRVIKGGFSCYISSVYVGFCRSNEKLLWHDPRLGIRKRKQVLLSKTGGNIWEYLTYTKYHRGGVQMILSATKTLIRLIVPGYFKG